MSRTTARRGMHGSAIDGRATRCARYATSQQKPVPTIAQEAEPRDFQHRARSGRQPYGAALSACDLHNAFFQGMHGIRRRSGSRWKPADRRGRSWTRLRRRDRHCTWWIAQDTISRPERRRKLQPGWPSFNVLSHRCSGATPIVRRRSPHTAARFQEGRNFRQRE